VLAESGKKLSELAALYQEGFVSIEETNFEVADKEAVIEKVSEASTDAEQDWLDGLTLNYDDAWVNIRPSNTEPLLRLNAEATTRERLDALVAKVTAVIEEGKTA